MYSNGRILKYMVEKYQHCHKGTLKGILVRPHKENRTAVEKASIFLENA